MMTPEDAKKVMEALVESLDLVQRDYADYFEMWRKVPTRAKQIEYLEQIVILHESAIEIMKKECNK